MLVIIEANPAHILPMPDSDNQPHIHLATIQFPIRWGDMDSLGHVNNVNYLRYFEESRVEWMLRHGMHLSNKGCGMIQLKATVTYKKPVVYPADVVVALYAGRVGNTSFTLTNTLHVKGDPETACEAEFIIVWFDYVANKPVAVPNFLRDLLSGKTA